MTDSTIAHYEILDKLGEGCMGVVYVGQAIAWVRRHIERERCENGQIG